MARASTRPTRGRPDGAVRTLVTFFVMVAALAAVLGGAVWKSTAQWTPKLGLDLEGGTQLVLKPRLVGDQTVTSQQVAQARDIIAERVDSQGVSGAEVTTQGADNIVVSMAGDPTRQQEDSLRRSSALQFRPVLTVAAGTPAPTPTSTSTGSSTSTGTSTSTSTATSTAPKTGANAGTGTSTGTASSNERKAATTGSSTTSTSASSTDKSTSSASGSATSSATPSGTPTSATDQAWVTPGLTTQFDALDCSKDGVLDTIIDDPAKPLVTCSTDKTAKYILGPVAVGGADITDAQAGYRLAQNGQPTNVVEIQLSLDSKATKTYGDLSIEMLNLPSPRNQLASVLDSSVIIAPQFNEPITNGQASITGGFTFQEAQELAKQLKFGSLPISFDLQTRTQISPTLGEEQLRLGILAGLVGLVLVVLYSLFQYRALGLVTVASIVIAALLTYLTIAILGWAQNYRLDMAGVTGLIVAIGVTADSFIVYFERIRDEVRDGRTLRTAVDTGWKRAKRTIVVADGVNFLGALVLYLLASSSVRGFAFTLGLTTLIDILVVFVFTHPVVSLLARRKFFADGHKLSGLDPERLGAKVRYAGRGRISAPRRAAAEGGQA
ncbi:MAG TPA: protein translocase subunit SecD [Tetrasphaera sp.]|uniref:protein translocase subunit SecD n=1 Tax=Nostocoides sp. TaxID=1917966 RepID=UPI002BAC5BE9|nr:protein translocase subunit SecD [Tetrasphaera sp.]HNQ05608.1 protein translocase subunit SecD [Tetrasphaera sp.]